MKRTGLCGTRGALSLLLVLLGASCAGVDPDDDGSAGADSDLTREMAEVALGTESGNPTEPVEETSHGTESGNPGLTESTPEEQVGTESGNPTRPPPAPVEVEVTVPVPSPDDATVEPTVGDEMTVTSVDLPTDPTEPVPMDTSEGMSSAPPPTAAVPDAVGASSDVCDLVDCAAQAEAAALGYAEALPPPGSLVSTSCEAGVCTCSFSEGPIALSTSEAAVCLAVGRLGCLYSSDDYLACETGTTSCEAACGEVQAARDSDALGVEVTVRASSCGTHGCRYVLEAAGGCFLDGSEIDALEVDCALSDDELVNSR